MEEKDTFKTVERPSGDSLLKEKGSKFIGYVYPIASEEDVKLYLEEVKKKHYAARHWCYAWQLGLDDISYRANDDGEPNNSAGQPIYGQILSFDVRNVLVIVVRYFGGVKLGVGGLISAYKETAKLTLEEATIVERIRKDQLRLVFEYADMNKVMRIVKEENIQIDNQKMEMNCEFDISVRKKEVEKVKRRLEELRVVKIKPLST